MLAQFPDERYLKVRWMHLRNVSAASETTPIGADASRRTFAESIAS